MQQGSKVDTSMLKSEIQKRVFAVAKQPKMIPKSAPKLIIYLIEKLRGIFRIGLEESSEFI